MAIQIVYHTRALTGRKGKGQQLKAWPYVLAGDCACRIGVGAGADFLICSKALYRLMVDWGGCLLHALNFTQMEV